jgi:hypothetical protein
MTTVFNLPILIDWAKFQPGTSFFIPCINRKQVQKFVMSECARLGLDVISKQVVENGVYGLRVWRKEVILAPHSTSA